MNDELTDQEISEIAPNLDPVKFISEAMREAAEGSPGGIDADLMRTTVAIMYSVGVKEYGIPTLPEPHTFNDAYTYVDALNREAWDTRDTEAIQRISEKHPECKTMGELMAKGHTSQLESCFSYNPNLRGFLNSQVAA